MVGSGAVLGHVDRLRALRAVFDVEVDAIALVDAKLELLSENAAAVPTRTEKMVLEKDDALRRTLLG